MNQSIVAHHHKFGTSTFVIEHECGTYEITEEMLLDSLPELAEEYEPDSDEWIDIEPAGDSVRMPF